ncbi:cyclase family protein [Paracrocinitomix mangrovi]|uniref:cyclase family protein n=1 Tax=Paracrocinitomix mangrovi TaxID=2862509 RepID=UPI001C8E038C|nr:cyclase family protein [Paracrocinitomix mangrovi]UKN00864.1 cyclase family protein [Paracrocinitomix mangrovi]
MILKLNEKEFIDTDAPIDISIPIHNGKNPVLAWYYGPIELTPVMTDQFIGDVNQGGAVNFRHLSMNPHAHGTHTECVGHISKEWYSINKCLKTFHFKAALITVVPAKVFNDEFQKEDDVVQVEAIKEAIDNLDLPQDVDALVIRTMPNGINKLSKNYSSTNPIYYDEACIHFINDLGIKHLIVDLPSVDREEDKGVLAAHHAFWDYPNNPQLEKSITELVFIPDEVKDGIYVANIQITSLENDASPSKVVLFKIQS